MKTPAPRIAPEFLFKKWLKIVLFSVDLPCTNPSYAVVGTTLSVFFPPSELDRCFVHESAHLSFKFFFFSFHRSRGVESALRPRGVFALSTSHMIFALPAVSKISGVNRFTEPHHFIHSPLFFYFFFKKLVNFLPPFFYHATARETIDFTLQEGGVVTALKQECLDL